MADKKSAEPVTMILSNLTWHLCSEVQPEAYPEDVDRGEWEFTHPYYLTLDRFGKLAVYSWFNGWNLVPGWEPKQRYDITRYIVAWAELPDGDELLKELLACQT